MSQKVSDVILRFFALKMLPFPATTVYTTVYSPIILVPAVAAEVNQVVDVAAPDGVGSGRVPVRVEDDVDGAVAVRQEVVLVAALLAATSARGALVLAVAGHQVPHQDGVQRVAAVSLLK